MPSRKISKRSFKQRASDFLEDIGFFKLIMRPCKNCSRSGLSCRVNESSEKCVGCIAADRRCDLSISSVTIRRIHNERKRIREEVRKARVTAALAQEKADDEAKKARDAISTVSRLKRQLEALKNQKKELISTEWQNIHELEVEKSTTDLSFFFLFDVAFEQFQLPLNLDWFSVLLPGLGEIVEVDSDNFQNSR